MFNNWGDMKLNKTLIAIGVFTALSLIALSTYALMQFAEEKYSIVCLLYTSPSPRDATLSRMPSSA